MTNASEAPKRVRLSVPSKDTSVISWLDEQENVSASLMLLIRESIRRDGVVDLMHIPVEQEDPDGRGRPSKGEIARRDAAVAEALAAERARTGVPAPVEQFVPSVVETQAPVPAQAETSHPVTMTRDTEIRSRRSSLSAEEAQELGLG